jgi:hypothetical protein
MTVAAFITELKSIFNDSAIVDTLMESLVDAVVDELNLQGYIMANMAGTAGSKTITLNASEEAAIRRIFRCIYASWNKNPQAILSVNTGAMSYSVADIMSNPTVLSMIERTASLLKQHSYGAPIYIANAEEE